MTNEMEAKQPNYEMQPYTAAQVLAQVKLIQEVMGSVMKEGQHYGKVAGKDVLLKAGAEKLAMTFRLAPDFEIVDLSTNDSIRYRIKTLIKGPSDNFLGAGVGEASTDEEKYRWRKSSDEEYAAASEDRRREKHREYQGKPYVEKQIRTNPADLANTVLKMAKKRSLVDAILTATAASDIFQQDTEENHEAVVETTATKAPVSDDPISKEQREQLVKATKDSGKTGEEVTEYLKSLGFKSAKEVPSSRFAEVLAFCSAKAEAKAGA